MFHQANMRTTNMDTVQVGDQTGQFSLIQIWVEAITQELGRLCVFIFTPTLGIPCFFRWLTEDLGHLGPSSLLSTTI